MGKTKKVKLYYYYQRDTITLDIPTDCLLIIKSKSSRCAGLSYHHEIDFTIDGEVIASLDNVKIDFDTNVGSFFGTQFIEKGFCVNIFNTDEFGSEYKMQISTKNDNKKLIKNLMSLSRRWTGSGLGFVGFKKMNTEEIVVEFTGHEVGGSYVHDYEVAPDYIESLQELTKRVVSWNGRRSGGFGCDIYEFTIFLNQKL
tara:strand:+ start:167739 stop:168335 length:597 start_codon:yes stop_codon:yes gene_type:complete